MTWSSSARCRREDRAGESSSFRCWIGPTVTAPPGGGRSERWYFGRIPGVVEEALASLRAGQPLYIVGGFGGAAALVADLLEGRRPPEFSWEFQRGAPHAPEMRKIYEARGPAWEDYDDMAAFLAQMGVAALSKVNKLDPQENRLLFETRDVGCIVSLIVAGLERL
jgi:hypothetical protein